MAKVKKIKKVKPKIIELSKEHKQESELVENIKESENQSSSQESQTPIFRAPSPVLAESQQPQQSNIQRATREIKEIESVNRAYQIRDNPDSRNTYSSKVYVPSQQPTPQINERTTNRRQISPQQINNSDILQSQEIRRNEDSKERYEDRRRKKYPWEL